MLELTLQSLEAGDPGVPLAAKPASLAPVVVAEVVASALARAPADRWSIREYVDKLEDLGTEFSVEREQPDKDKVQWTTLDWWDMFEQAFRSRQGENSIREHHELRGEESSTWTLPEDSPIY